MANTMTEQDVIDKLMQLAKDGGVIAPRIVVVERSQKPSSITRYVKFALVVPTNEVLLIDKLIFGCLEFNDKLSFAGSNINLQGDLDIDYLYFEVQIMAQKR